MTGEQFLKFLSYVCMFFILLGDATVICKKSAATRVISLQHNPGCDIPECNATNNSSMHIVYARAKGSNDSLHYIFSTVGPSPPTLLLLRSSDNAATLNVNWTKLIKDATGSLLGAVRLVSEAGQEAEAGINNVIIFDRVLEYNDSTDAAQYNASLAFSPLQLRNFEWNVSSSAHSFLMTGMTTKYPKSLSNESSVSLNVTIFGRDGQADILPSLPHNENSSDWDFVLSNLLTRGNGSRFAIKLVTLRDDSIIVQSKQKSINDEYSPAVFTTEKIEWTDIKTVSAETYSQWRAVSYTTGDHQRKFSTDVDTSDLMGISETSSLYEQGILQNRLLCAYFGLYRLGNMKAGSIRISFGQPEDGFYTATDYLSWTSSIGFAVPPSDSFSLLVICMLLAGVGCPLAVIVVGGFYVIILRLKRKRRSSFQDRIKTNYDYQPIQ